MTDQETYYFKMRQVESGAKIIYSNYSMGNNAATPDMTLFFLFSFKDSEYKETPAMTFTKYS